MLTISLIVFTDMLTGHVHTFYSKWYFIVSVHNYVAQMCTQEECLPTLFGVVFQHYDYLVMLTYFMLGSIQ